MEQKVAPVVAGIFAREEPAVGTVTLDTPLHMSGLDTPLNMSGLDTPLHMSCLPVEVIVTRMIGMHDEFLHPMTSTI